MANYKDKSETELQEILEELIESNETLETLLPDDDIQAEIDANNKSIKEINAMLAPDNTWDDEWIEEERPMQTHGIDSDALDSEEEEEYAPMAAPNFEEELDAMEDAGLLEKDMVRDKKEPGLSVEELKTKINPDLLFKSGGQVKGYPKKTTVRKFFNWYAGRDWDKDYQTANSMFIDDEHAQDDGKEGLNNLSKLRDKQYKDIVLNIQETPGGYEYEFKLDGKKYYIDAMDIYGIGGVLGGAVVGGYVGYKIGRARPQKTGFDTEKELIRKAKKTKWSKDKGIYAKGGEISREKLLKMDGDEIMDYYWENQTNHYNSMNNKDLKRVYLNWFGNEGYSFEELESVERDEMIWDLIEDEKRYKKGYENAETKEDKEEVIDELFYFDGYAKGGKTKDISLKKGDVIKFKNGESIYILGPKGDGYDYQERGRREKGHHPKKWFDMMISSGKAEVVYEKGGKTEGGRYCVIGYENYDSEGDLIGCFNTANQAIREGLKLGDKGDYPIIDIEDVDEGEVVYYIKEGEGTYFAKGGKVDVQKLADKVIKNLKGYSKSWEVEENLDEEINNIIYDNTSFSESNDKFYNLHKKVKQLTLKEFPKGFAKGGKTKDYSYDYADIGQFSIDRRLWGEFTNKQFEKIGRDIVKVNFNKDIEKAYDTIVRKKFAKGGALEKEFKFDKNFVIYVPSTSDVGNKISKKELEKRVKEVEKFVANEFGGYTETDTDGGYKANSGEIIEEDIVKVSVFANNKDWKDNERKVVSKVKKWAKEWGQEAIGFEYEGDLYYIDDKGKYGLGGYLMAGGIGAYLGAKNPSTVKKVTDPLDNAVKQIGKNFTDKKSYAKGGAIYEGDKVKIKDSGKKMKVTDISKNKKDQVEFKGREGTFLIGDIEKMAKGGKVKEIKLEIEKLKKENPEGFKAEIKSLQARLDHIKSTGEDIYPYAEGGDVDENPDLISGQTALDLYASEEEFTPEQDMQIDQAIDGQDLDTDEIRDNFYEWVFKNKNDWFAENEEITGDKRSYEIFNDFIGEMYSNGLTHRQNWREFLEFSQDELPKYRKGGVLIYKDPSSSYTVVIDDSVFEMNEGRLNYSVNMYIGERSEYPEDVSHWGEQISLKDAPIVIKDKIKERENTSFDKGGITKHNYNNAAEWNNATEKMRKDILSSSSCSPKYSSYSYTLLDPDTKEKVNIYFETNKEKLELSPEEREGQITMLEQALKELGGKDRELEGEIKKLKNK